MTSTGILAEERLDDDTVSPAGRASAQSTTLTTLRQYWRVDRVKRSVGPICGGSSSASSYSCTYTTAARDPVSDANAQRDSIRLHCAEGVPDEHQHLTSARQLVSLHIHAHPFAHPVRGRRRHAFTRPDERIGWAWTSPTSVSRATHLAMFQDRGSRRNPTRCVRTASVSTCHCGRTLALMRQSERRDLQRLDVLCDVVP